MPETQAQAPKTQAPKTHAKGQYSPAADIQTAAGPIVKTWSVPKDKGFTVGGTARITLTNVTDTPVVVRIDRLQAELEARGMLTLNLDRNRNQTVTLEAPDGGEALIVLAVLRWMKHLVGGEAEGFFVLHDFDAKWNVPSIGARADLSFQGPATFVLVSDPQSTLVVEWLADGGVRQRVEPGFAESAPFSREEARSMAVVGMRNVLGQGSASGLVCSLDAEAGEAAQ